MLYRILLIAAIGATLLLAGCPKPADSGAAGGTTPAAGGDTSGGGDTSSSSGGE